MDLNFLTVKEIQTIMSDDIQLRFQILRLPLKSTVRHAAASRKEGESLLVQACRGSFFGFGEGCPRDYVTGETLESSREWLTQNLSEIRTACQNLDQLQRWQRDHDQLIDTAPSSWCAVECALLDLFSRERRCSVETLMGLPGPLCRYQYTAVLSDSSDWRFTFAADNYLIRGLTDFKVKLSGALEKDSDRLKRLLELCQEHDVTDARIRLDANNLWQTRPDIAVDYLSKLDVPFFAVEEPVGARHVEAISRISQMIGRPVILDESLCKLDDLRKFDGVPGQFIANLKVSKVGGVLRGLQLIKAIQDRGWSIIVGAHVGETSLLTRAGFLFATASGDSLLAHEGAFGSYLLEWDPTEPDLKFGRSGIIDLTRPYAERTALGLKFVNPENWEAGWGLTCSWSPSSNQVEERILTCRMSDGYDIHYRLWGPEAGDDVLVILHGGMSHSMWQYPLAQALRAKSELSVIAPDRRGCGLNQGRGELGTMSLVINDLLEHLIQIKHSFKRIHLVGWCQGAQFASVAAAKMQSENILSSLILMTPGFFWNDRFRSVIDNAEKMLFSLRSSFKAEPNRNKVFVPIPMQATDFTFQKEWLVFIHEDPLKTSKVTMKSALIMDEMQEMSWSALPALTLPLLVILADKDRIVDNRKSTEVLLPLIQAYPKNRLVTMETAHAIQFEGTEELGRHILSFLNNIKN